jgi:F0F1-type ATP synthase assembly protein I
MSQPDDPKKDRLRVALNLTLASVAGQVGCVTLVVIFLALIAGLWLDRYFSTKPLFTIVLLIGSVPVTLILMFRIVKVATNRIKPVQTKDSLEEETHRGTDA